MKKNELPMELLDNAIRDYLENREKLLERTAPGASSVPEFEKEIRDHIIDTFEEAPGGMSQNHLIGVDETDMGFFEAVTNEIEDYISKSYGAGVMTEPPVLVPPRDAPQTDGERWDMRYKSVSDVGSSKHYTIWTVINDSLYYWKLSTSESMGTSLRAADYEVAICAGYNIYKRRDSEDNPFVIDGDLDPKADVTADEIRRYVDLAVDGSASDSEIQKTISAINTGLGVILRNSKLQSKGDQAIQYGAASADTSSAYTGEDSTPKTDFYFTDGPNVSLKKKGSNPQLMSGQVKDARAVFDAAMHYFDEEEKDSKREIKEELVESFEEDFEKIDRPTKQTTISSIRDEALDSFRDRRKREVKDMISDILSKERVRDELSGIESKNGTVTMETMSGDSYEIDEHTSGTEIEAIAAAHAKAELKYHGIASRGRSNFEERVISDLLIDRKRIVRMVDDFFGQNEVDRINEISKSVLKRTLDHREATDKAKRLVEESDEFGKWAVFEAATGLYKFDGPSSSPFSDLEDASLPVANTYLKFDQVPGTKGRDVLHEIDESWVEERGKNINVRVSFKTREGGFYSTLRLEGEDDGSSAIGQAIEEERQSMLEDIEKQIKLRKAVHEDKLNEDVLGYDVMGALRKVVKRGKGMLDYISKRFKQFISDVMNRIRNVIDDALSIGLDRLFEVLGMEVQEVQFSSVKI